MKANLPVVLALLLVPPSAIADAALAAPPAPPREVAAIPVSLLYDMASGQVLQARQPDLRFVPASMAKVMTAYVAFEAMQRGTLGPARMFTVQEGTARVWNGRGTSMYLTGGTQVSADMLLRGIATASANDASVVLAEGYSGSVPAWTALMNAQARRLGMTRSHFATPNGWPDEGATYVSARDLVTLGEAMIAGHPGRYRTYFGQKRMAWGAVTLESHDPTVGVVPGADGIKTGHTGEAGYNFLGSAVRGERRLIMVIAGAKSGAERASASRALLEWGFTAWQARPLFAAGVPVAEAQVQDGAARSVPLTGRRAIMAALPAGSNAPVSLRITYRGPIIAPVAKGAKLAELEIRVGDLPPGHVPLYAARSVGKAGFFDRIYNGVAGLFS